MAKICGRQLAARLKTPSLVAAQVTRLTLAEGNVGKSEPPYVGCYLFSGLLAICSRNLAYRLYNDGRCGRDPCRSGHIGPAREQAKRQPMNIQRKWWECRLGIASFAFTMILACPSFTATAGKVPAGFTERDAEVNGVRIDYSIGGKSSPAIATLAATAPTLVGERLPSIVKFSSRH
jgi:hypothetical protein